MKEKILADIIDETIDIICRYADAFDFDRDQVLYSVAEMLSAISEICSIREYNAEEPR